MGRARTGARRHDVAEAAAAERVDAALALASAGFAVFPLAPGGKRPPAGTRGVTDATADPAAVRAAFAAAPRGANVGLATAGLLAVDVDPAPGGGPNPWLTPAVRREFRGVPSVATPRGGIHLYFRQPTGGRLRNTRGRLAPGVDTRAGGGYVVAPPSVVNGRRYRWTRRPVDAAGLPEPPAWVVERVRPRGRTGRKTTKADRGPTTRRDRRPDRPATCCRCGAPVPDGRRFRVGTRRACGDCRPTVKRRASVQGGDLLNLHDRLTADLARAEAAGDGGAAERLRASLGPLAAKLAACRFRRRPPRAVTHPSRKRRERRDEPRTKHARPATGRGRSA